MRTLRDEIVAVADSEGYDLDIIFVDDGSSDESWNRISELAATDDRVRGIRFRRNFGKAAALSAGFASVQGELVMTMDADLQDDPKEIPRFLAEIDAGFDVVSGWKKVRHDPWHKVGPSRVFNGLVSWLTGGQVARPQLRLQMLSQRDIQGSSSLWRAAPVRARPRRSPRLEGWRSYR